MICRVRSLCCWNSAEHWWQSFWQSFRWGKKMVKFISNFIWGWFISSFLMDEAAEVGVFPAFFRRPDETTWPLFAIITTFSPARSRDGPMRKQKASISCQAEVPLTAQDVSRCKQQLRPPPWRLLYTWTGLCTRSSASARPTGLSYSSVIARRGSDGIVFPVLPRPSSAHLRVSAWGGCTARGPLGAPRLAAG